MASLDIFNNDAFQVSRLTQTITDIPRVPTQLGDEGLFSESGISTTSMMIERTGSKLALVPTAPRGGTGQTAGRDKRKLIPIAAVHLPQRDTILADEVQNVRAFGSESEVDSVMRLVTRQMTKLKANLDLTMEYQRIGALKGLVLDADGVDVIYDLYQLFGMQQKVIGFNINSASSGADPKQNSINVKRAIRNALGGRSFTRVRVKASESWFDKFVGHDRMAAAWERWNNGQFAREDQTQGDFEFAGVVYQIYSGGTSDGDFIEQDTAYAYPEGVPGMFQTVYAPADYMETVNTNGLPYYAKQELLRFNKGVEIETQSNPINFNTLPEAVIKLTTKA